MLLKGFDRKLESISPLQMQDRHHFVVFLVFTNCLDKDVCGINKR